MIRLFSSCHCPLPSCLADPSGWSIQSLVSNTCYTAAANAALQSLATGIIVCVAGARVALRAAAPPPPPPRCHARCARALLPPRTPLAPRSAIVLGVILLIVLPIVLLILICCCGVAMCGANRKPQVVVVQQGGYAPQQPYGQQQPPYAQQLQSYNNTARSPQVPSKV